MGDARKAASRAGTKITGVSLPFFGIQWEPGVPDVRVAEAIIAYMEDRRVLYNPIMVEDGNRCVQSVVQMRDELTMAIQANGVNKNMLRQFREIRAACRKFCDQLELGADVAEGIVVRRFVDRHGRGNQWVESMHHFQLNQSLGELRAVVGERLAAIAHKYGIEVEPELSSIFPYPTD